MWIGRAKSLAPSATAAGFQSRQALCRGVKPLARLASRMISPTLVASGSMKRHSARGIWCGGELSRTFQISVESWLPHSLNKYVGIEYPWADWRANEQVS